VEKRVGGGPIALVGSGEYTPAMDETDRALLGLLGRGPATVAVIPTASGLEPGMPQRWNAQGVAHFERLGARALPIPLITRDHAQDAAIVELLAQADLFYFSGGNPEYVSETLRETRAWATIQVRHAAGAALAGCSAGAMMLGGATLRVRAVAAGQPPQWVAALGLLPDLVVFPHFDRVAGFVGPETFARILASAPPGATLLGVDEDTALMRISTAELPARWQVFGRQRVVILGRDGQLTAFRSGELVPDVDILARFS
jgi:cyanophycinase